MFDRAVFRANEWQSFCHHCILSSIHQYASARKRSGKILFYESELDVRVVRETADAVFQMLFAEVDEES
jgi:hypothetical protein